MVLFDIEKAFDRVWHAGLIYKLHKLEFPIYIIKIIGSFLENRKFIVKVGSSNSETKSIPYGLPQGSTLSPTLYNLFINDIPEGDTEMALYADDTAIFTSSRFAKTIEKRLQKKSKQLLNYFTKWKITINKSKTNAIFFTRRKTKQLPKTHITINKNKIKWENNIKYLGVEFNKNLKYNLHIAKSLTKIDNITKLIYPLICRKSALGIKSKLLIYKAYIRPLMLYSCPVLRDVSNSMIKKYQTKQNKFIKMIYNMPWYSSTKLIHQISKLNYIKDQINIQTTKFLRNCANIDNSIVINFS